MSKFHINKNGVPAPCKAQTGNCPLGGSESHFTSKKDAQAYVDKQNEGEYQLMPDVAAKLDSFIKTPPQKSSKLTQAQERARVKAIREEKLKVRLGRVWKRRDEGPDEEMIKHCLQNTKYVEIGDSFVDVADLKPKIHKELWYDDETYGPDLNFESFRDYNIESEMPKFYKLSGRNRNQKTGSLKMIPQYDGVNGLELTSLTYEDSEDLKVPYKEVNEEQLEEINKGIKEVRENYEKRLKTYYDKYSDKLRATGYWKNR